MLHTLSAIPEVIHYDVSSESLFLCEHIVLRHHKGFPVFLKMQEWGQSKWIQVRWLVHLDQFLLGQKSSGPNTTLWVLKLWEAKTSIFEVESFRYYEDNSRWIVSTHCFATWLPKSSARIKDQIKELQLIKRSITNVFGQAAGPKWLQQYDSCQGQTYVWIRKGIPGPLMVRHRLDL